jgi:hypothetical protein
MILDKSLKEEINNESKKVNLRTISKINVDINAF